ncbi:unnamed protein product [Candidula unifasciata]|uniref:Uncharacterized protein n=1 Tax=Candidula unifasciata TaxID=100452 RepID=A0A8S3YCN4_9EUPU|nr:unnamed protein product [Candidula unifasciata]
MSSQDSVTTQLSSPGVPHEESILDNYFELLSQNHCDKAKELVDSEKDGHKFSYAAYWGETLQCLSQLATAEKNYSHLVFLSQKRFTQIVRTKDSAKSIYSMLLQEFQRMENSFAPSLSRSIDAESEQLLAHINGQLCYFVRARIRLIEFYEQLAGLGANRQAVNFEDLVVVCEEIQNEYIREFHHPLVSPLRAVCSFECDILCHLLRAQVLMSTWSYLPCVVQLYHAHSKLNSWSDMIPMKEVKTAFGRSTGKISPLPPLYNWLFKLKGFLLSKFGFYFYDTLAKQTVPAELKVALSKCPEDFVGKVQAFQKKSDASDVYLVLNAHGLTGHVREGGYHHPDKYAEPLKGMETYLPIFSYPHERVINVLHWPNIVMLINTDSEADKVRFFYEKLTERRPHSSYFIVRADSRISLVVVFECKKNEKDSSINSFMSDMATQLRCQNVMAGIKSFARS